VDAVRLVRSLGHKSFDRYQNALRLVGSMNLKLFDQSWSKKFMEVVRQTMCLTFETNGRPRLSFDQYRSTSSRTMLTAMPMALTPTEQQTLEKTRGECLNSIICRDLVKNTIRRENKEDIVRTSALKNKHRMCKHCTNLLIQPILRQISRLYVARRSCNEHRSPNNTEDKGETNNDV